MNDQKITILTDREHVLKRSGMYVGSTKPEKQIFWVPTESGSLERKEIEYIPALFKLFSEIVDNAVDETAVRGFGDTVNIQYDKDTGFITVSDNGRGIPIEIHDEAKVHIPQVVFAHLRSGSNFDDNSRETVGMNGVGATLCTIFSEKLLVQIKRDGKIYQQVFKNNLEVIDAPVINKETKQKSTGTFVKFKPDPKIFSQQLPEILVHKRALELSVMYPKLTINVRVNSSSEECFNCNEIKTYQNSKFESFVKLFGDVQSSIYEDSKSKTKFALVENKHTEQFEHYSIINGADTFRGGTHVDSLKEIICKDFKEKIWKDQKLEVQVNDIAKNMILVILQTWNAPTFEGQTKEKFVNDKTEVRNFYDDIISSRRLTSIASEVQNIIKKTIDDVMLKNEKKTLQDLKATQKSLDKKKIAKLIEASGRDRNTCSLYITEGDSAISNLAMVRNAKTMAGLPLRGKIMNVFESSAKEVLENKEIQAIMAAIGLKIGESPLVVRLNKVEKNNLNYGKIIIATDQDMDGYSIRCLLINFLFKWWPDLIKHGFVYILETPLYEALDKKTSEANYFYNKKDFEKWISNKNTSKYEISYFKGLGSCGKEAWNYMINENPNLVQITAQDAVKSADILKMAFSEDSEARKKWLTE
jgi:DNA topoisomerase-2